MKNIIDYTATHFWARLENDVNKETNLLVTILGRLTRPSYARSREFESHRLTKSYIALQTVRHRFTSTQAAVLPWRYDAELGTANSLHASV